MVTDDSAMLVARIIFLIPGGGLGEGRGRKIHHLLTQSLTHTLNTLCWSLEDSIEWRGRIRYRWLWI